MKSAWHITAMGLPVGLALLTQMAFAQSLSIVRTAAGEARVDAVAPPGTRYTVEEGHDLRDWYSVVDEVVGEVSLKIELAASSTRFFRLIEWTEPPPPIILALIGDSTIREYAAEWNHSGWGGGIPGYLKPEVQVVNLGWPCFSTRAFLDSEQKTKLLLIKPDFILIQFGLIDLYGCPEVQFDTTLPEYADNLKVIVELVRSFDGVPILVTPTAPRIFGTDGRVIPIMDNHSAVVRQVAAELQTDLVDLYQSSLALFNQLGDIGSAYRTAGKDPHHFSVKGAEVIAGLVVKDLPPSLRPYLVRRPRLASQTREPKEPRHRPA